MTFNLAQLVTFKANNFTVYIYIYTHIQGVAYIGPKKNEDLAKSCNPSRFFQKKGFWLLTFCSRILLSAELGWSNEWKLVFNSLFSYHFKTKISKLSPRSTKIPIITVISETEFLQRLVVGKNHHFQFSVFAMFTGVRRDLWICLFDLTLQTPKTAKSLHMGPQNIFEQPLRHYKIRYLRAFRSYFCPNRSYSKQHLGPNFGRFPPQNRT